MDQHHEDVLKKRQQRQLLLQADVAKWAEADKRIAEGNYLI